MRMSSSMYEVFNWNSSPDPPLTPAKHKRASLSLPPTTDIFAVDDKSDNDARRPMIQRAASGESWCLRSLQESRERSLVLFVSRMNIDPLSLVLFSIHSHLRLSPFLSLILHHYVFLLLHCILYWRMSRSFNIVKTYSRALSLINCLVVSFP